jgi:hypothetical protein
MNATISGSMITIQGDLWLRFQNDFGSNQGNIAFFPYGTLRRDTSMPVGRPVVRPEDPTRRVASPTGEADARPIPLLPHSG